MQWNLMSLGSVIPTATFTTLLAFELVLVEKEKEFIGKVLTLKSNHVFFFSRLMVVSTRNRAQHRVEHKCIAIHSVEYTITAGEFLTSPWQRNYQHERIHVKVVTSRKLEA